MLAGIIVLKTLIAVCGTFLTCIGYTAPKPGYHALPACTLAPRIYRQADRPIFAAGGMLTLWPNTESVHGFQCPQGVSTFRTLITFRYRPLPAAVYRLIQAVFLRVSMSVFRKMPSSGWKGDNFFLKKLFFLKLPLPNNLPGQ